MAHPIPPDEAPDLALLEAFIASDSVPEDCMTLSEMDGFLAGIVAGPEMIMPSEWLHFLWGDDDPVFDDMDQANAIFGVIQRRYNQIIAQLNAMPPAYEPVLATNEAGKVDASDWALGFIAAIALRQDAWEPLTTDPKAGVMLAPIMLIASTSTKANLPLDEDETLPPEEMAKLLESPKDMLNLCTAGIRMYFQEAPPRPARRRRAPAKKKPAGKRRGKR